ncbi:MAG: DNA polymerase III subunit delta' [Myxococcota bacterium]
MMVQQHDILGHTAVLQRLAGAVHADSLHHAYLFEGPKGVGKACTAGWLAMLAACERPHDGDPCGSCTTCRLIQSGNHPDIVWVRPNEQGKISVSDIRDVVRAASYRRFGAKRRTFIIDGAETMNGFAANALLKTLEEPPVGTGFILITGQARALLPTILSRCQRVRFQPVPSEPLVSWLRERGHEDAVTLAQLSEGCPGRALAIAEGAFDKRAERLQRVFEAVGQDLGSLFKVSETLSKGGRARALDEVLATLEVLDEFLRDTMVLQTEAELPLLHPDQQHVARVWGRALWPDGLHRCSAAIRQTRRRIGQNVTLRTALDALWTTLATELGRARDAGLGGHSG